TRLASPTQHGCLSRSTSVWAGSGEGSRRTAADRPSARDRNADASAVLLMARVRAAAAWPQTTAASSGSSRAATALRPPARAFNAYGSVALLMAPVRVAAAWPQTTAASFGS